MRLPGFCVLGLLYLTSHAGQTAQDRLYKTVTPMISKKHIDGGAPFDWGRAAQHYARYRDIYPPEFYRRILDAGLCTAGQRVLDLGTGTGVLPRNLYKHGAKFTGVDISEAQIAEARRLSREAGMEIACHAGPAEQMPFAEDSFDTVTASQCFLYFDVAKLMPVLKKVMAGGGRLAILFMAWLPGESEIAKASESLVLRYSPDWSGYNLRRELAEVPPWLDRYGFTLEENTGYDVDVAFTKESWNGRMVACRGVGASLPPEKVAAFEREHLQLLDALTAENTFTIPHYVTMTVLKNNKPTL